MNETLERSAPLATDRTAPRPVPAAPRPGPTGRFERFGREVGYLLTGLPLGIVAFTLAVTGFFLGLGTLVIWVGLPVLVWTLTTSRYLAGVERERIGSVTGRPIPRPAYRSGGMLRVLGDAQAWRDLVHAIVSFPLRVVTFCVAVTWTVGGLGALLYVTWSWALPREDGEEGLPDLIWGVESEAADIAFNTGIGVVLLATAIPVLRVCTAMQAGLARTLLADGTR
ncbi:sensor domain-containing protein [Streptomyces johnsoniae]|uniref:Sensor domain-containing protein n=1 Tax=Streptomyces johnsoniae TaxID=3075532 RepID=A0ABU2SDK0_9ACTN|nr:sensor domain-containing protein [Streptomyces sp. DSM 41886]MDT0445904.1 sensor domain-containing protein [Streptomyces sp. DSM 41886]